MANPINSIVAEIDSLIGASIGISGVCFHGLTQLVEKPGRTYPVPYLQTRGDAITPESKTPLQIYHRINAITENESPFSFGLEIKTRTQATMSLFGLGVQEVILSQREDINIDAAYETFESMPRTAFDAGNYLNIRLASFSLVTDKDTVLQGEFRGNTALDKLKLSLVAFRVDYTIQFDGCDNCG